MQRPSNEQVLEALRSAGWLLEQDAERTLRENDFRTYPNFAYADLDDSNTSREIDVMAFRYMYQDDTTKLSVGIRVIAECKQSVNPYVLIGHSASAGAHEDARPEWIPRFHTVTVPVGSDTNGDLLERQLDSHLYLGLHRLTGSPWATSFEATQMTRMDRHGGDWRANNEGIFTSLMRPLAKAVTRVRSTQIFDGVHRVGEDYSSVEFLFPVVVTSAPVYVVDVDQAPMNPTEVPWATVTRDFATQRVNGRFRTSVVTFESFDRWLKEKVIPFGEALGAHAASDPAAFVTREDPDWTDPGFAE